MYLRVIIELLVIQMICATEDLPERHLVQPRIFGGRETNLKDLGGYAVQIFKEDTLVCTGSLLNKLFVLTAAHCFEDADPTDFYVVAGKTEQNYVYFLLDRNYVIDARIHPDFNKYQFIADIAVVKVQMPMIGANIGYLPICNRTLFPGNRVTVSGWGRSEVLKDGNSLRKMVVPLVSKPQCSKKLGRKMPINVICAAGYDRRTICNGDSGGPMVFKGQLCGVSTWTFECGNTIKPDIYMSVYVYRKFIKNAMKEMGY